MKNREYGIVKNFVVILFISLTIFAGVVSAVPATEWTKTFDLTNSCGGLPDCIEQNTVAESVQQTRDGGYIFAGYRHYLSHPPDPGVVDKTNAFLIKTDVSGNKVWSKIFQLANDQGSQINSVNQTRDGGYILAGYVNLPYVGSDAWLIKTDASGNKVWDKKFGGPIIAGISGDEFYSVQQTGDGGYITAGVTSSATGGKVAWLVKTDASGNKVWDKKFGGPSYSYMNSVRQTKDGGYILAGFKEQTLLTYNAWVIRTDSSGNKVWEKSFGETPDDAAYSAEQTKDGNYIVAGHTASYGAGSKDVWLIKLNANGNILWSKTFGSSGNEGAKSVQQTKDGGYILAGYAGTNGWILKTDANGNKVWDKSSGAGQLISIKQTNSGGYITSGYRQIRSQFNVALLVKLGADTTAPANILKNPGFEVISGSLPQYWAKTQTGTKATFTYPAPGRVGGKAVAIRYAIKETGKVALWQQVGITVSPSKQYKLSGYMKLEGVTGGGVSPRYNGASLRVTWYTSANVLIRTDVITKSGTLGWAKYEKTFTAPSNAAKATVAGDLYNAAGKVTFDDMSFMKVS